VFGSNYASQGAYFRTAFTLGQTNISGTTNGTQRFDFGYDNGYLVPFNAIGSNNSDVSSDTDNKGLIVATRQGASVVKLFRNNVLKVNGTQSFSSYPALNYFIAARNAGTPQLFSNMGNLAFHFIGDGLTDDDATNLYYSTQVFQTTLGRQIGSPAYALPAVNDVNAKLYLSAINSSDPTVNGAVDTFISGLKTDGIYSKMKAVYPFVTDNVNLLSYTEDFGNGYWQKQNTSAITNATIAPNGTLTANKLNENGANGYHSFSFPTGVITTTNPYTCSFYAKAAERTWCSVYLYDGTAYEAFFDLVNGVVGSVASGMTATIINVGNGWYRCTVTRSVTITASTNGGIISAIGNNQSNYTGTSGSGIYVWGAQLQESSTATTYQPQLGSAQSYFANQFKYNMINPQDDDSAFRLVFNGGWTHSPQGALPNGVNGYADTKLVPSSNFTSDNNISLGYYTRNFASGGITLTGEMGSANLGLGNGVYLIIYYNVTGQSINRVASNTSQLFSISPIAGFYSLSRTTSANFKLFRNSVLLDTPAITSSGRTSNSMWIGGVNYGTAAEYGQGQCAFSFIGDGLTDTEAANLYTRVQNLQTLLNRQIP
jgi:hypothetical protein